LEQCDARYQGKLLTPKQRRRRVTKVGSHHRRTPSQPPGKGSSDRSVRKRA
jgi:hypothetical protein